MSQRAPAAVFAREAWKNIRTAPGLTLVAVLTIAVSLILVGLFGFVVVNADRLLDRIGRDLRVTVYLEPDVTTAQVDVLVQAFEERDEVDSVTVLSADEDRARNKAALPPDLLEGLDDEAIPGQPVIEVQLKPRQRRKGDFRRLPEWISKFEGVEGVQDLYFGADKLRVVFAIVDLLRLAGLIISIIVLTAAVFFTFSTIKLAVYARQDEIEVLRLIGATDGYIRAPFYIEGAVAGLLGSALALLAVVLIHGRLSGFLQSERAINIDLDLLPAGMVVWLVLGGIALGLGGSALSVRRYLREP